MAASTEHHLFEEAAPAALPPLVHTADDDPDIAALVGYRLERAGYRVLIASDGREALGLARQYRPDLLVLDVEMPYLSGYEVTEELRRDPELEKTPVLLLTGRRTEDDVLAGLTAGATEYLMKPFSPQDLEAKVAELVRSR
jgi:DNA-binding response OmpR family regulator